MSRKNPSQYSQHHRSELLTLTPIFNQQQNFNDDNNQRQQPSEKKQKCHGNRKAQHLRRRIRRQQQQQQMNGNINHIGQSMIMTHHADSNNPREQQLQV